MPKDQTPPGGKVVSLTPAAEGLAEITEQLEHHYAEMQRLGRLAVEEAWRVGDLLVKAKQLVDHGRWFHYLKERGIATRTAQRYMQLRGQFEDMRQIGAFASVHEALTTGTSREAKQQRVLDNHLERKPELEAMAAKAGAEAAPTEPPVIETQVRHEQLGSGVRSFRVERSPGGSLDTELSREYSPPPPLLVPELPEDDGENPPGTFELTTAVLEWLPALRAFCARNQARTIATGLVNEKGAEARWQAEEVARWFHELERLLEVA